MEYTRSVIFHKNLRLIQTAYESVNCFRRQEYKRALEQLLETIDQVTVVVEKMIEQKEEFQEELCSKICQILSEILEAKKNLDYVFLADCLEEKLIPLMSQLQESILSKEKESNYSPERYDTNIRILYRSFPATLEESVDLVAYQEALATPLRTRELIDAGYRIEMTSTGVMTAAVANRNTTFYLHSSVAPLQEAYLLAEEWYQPQAKEYHIYGLGLGYHMEALCRLVGTQVPIYVYESDINMVRLSCAFSSYLWMKAYPNVHVIYDPLLQLHKNLLKLEPEKKELRIHYPSYRNLKEPEAKAYLSNYISFEKMLETC